MTIREGLLDAMVKMVAGRVRVPTHLYVTPTEYLMGEAWVRRRYGIGPNIQIVEARPFPKPTVTITAPGTPPADVRELLG